MERKKITIRVLAFLIAGLVSLLRPFPAITFADEIVVSGNGSESVNTVTNTSNAETAVQQSNQSQVINTSTINAETGGNSASQNSGAVSMSTGDVSTDTTIKTQGNTSQVNTSPCCLENEKNTSVTGNGTNSSNEVNISQTTTITANVNQAVSLTNNISGTAVTGGNKVNDNKGSVSIITGNIKHTESITNGPVNISSVALGLPNDGYSVIIDGNGAGSANNINTFTSLSSLTFVNNTTNIANTSFWNLLTGNNDANRNNGDVIIATGNIDSKVSITNQTNDSQVQESCCVKKQIVPTPTSSVPTPSENNEKPAENNGCGSCGSSGSSNGLSGSAAPIGGSILPVTGGSSWFVLLFLGNIVMLFFGMVLRLRSGRSPGFRYRFVI